VTASASDYTWFAEDFPALAQAYCLTLVRDTNPLDVLHRLGGRSLGRLTGVDSIYLPAAEALDGAKWFVAVTKVESWSLAVESNGALGVNFRAARRLSAGTTLVAQYRNLNADTQFLWIDDGRVQLSFDLLVPLRRAGDRATEMADAMRSAGFDLDTDDPDGDTSTEAGLALVEQVTLVKLTANVLANATYVYGTVDI
jgi:Family of unknown function (DUF6461)